LEHLICLPGIRDPAVPGGGSALMKVSWSFGAFIGLIAAIVSFVPMATSVIRARSGRAA